MIFKKIRILNKSEKQKALINISKIFNGRNNAIKFLDDYGSMILEAKRKAAAEKPKPELSKEITKCKNYSLKLCEEFTKKIRNDEKNINDQILKKIFYHTSLFLSK